MCAEKYLQRVAEEADDGGSKDASPTKRNLVNLDELGVMGFSTHASHETDEYPIQPEEPVPEIPEESTNKAEEKSSTEAGILEAANECPSNLHLLPLDLLPRIIVGFPQN